MSRLEKIGAIRQTLALGNVSIGSWMQIPHASVAEIMGQAGYDWVAVDLEHGAIGVHQLPDLFRALELGQTLPLARIAKGQANDCKQALDAGAGGVIVPMIESADQLKKVRDACCWPPAGYRGVGFSRANLFGKNFDPYIEEAQSPLLVAMIENICVLSELHAILDVQGLDAILIGPYDLSASMGIVAQFNHPHFVDVINQIKEAASKHRVACGLHIVMPNREKLNQHIQEGYRFLAYSIDAVFLTHFAELPREYHSDWRLNK